MHHQLFVILDNIFDFMRDDQPSISQGNYKCIKEESKKSIAEQHKSPFITSD